MSKPLANIIIDPRISNMRPMKSSNNKYISTWQYNESEHRSIVSSVNTPTVFELRDITNSCINYTNIPTADNDESKLHAFANNIITVTAFVVPHEYGTVRVTDATVTNMEPIPQSHCIVC